MIEVEVDSALYSKTPRSPAPAPRLLGFLESLRKLVIPNEFLKLLVVPANSMK